jgi:hypothetical protein
MSHNPAAKNKSGSTNGYVPVFIVLSLITVIIMKKPLHIAAATVCIFYALFGDIARARADEIRPFFVGIEQAVVYVHLPQVKYQDALKCHGIEEQCVNATDTQRRARKIAVLKEDYQLYPAPLRVPALQEALAEWVRVNIKPPVTPIIVSSMTEAKKHSHEKGTLLFLAQVRIETKETPAMAKLQITLYRRDMELPLSPYSNAFFFPLTLTEAEVAERMKGILQGFAGLTVRWIEN